MRVGFFLLLLGFSGSLTLAQQVITPKRPIVCYGNSVDQNTIITDDLLRLKTGRAKTATFSVEYIGFSEEAKNAFQAAVDIWSTLITSPQPIHVVAQWQPLGSGVLGSAIWGSAYSNFNGAPNVNTYYPVALAEKIAARPLNHPDSADIVANFSSTMAWSYDLTGKPVSGKYDLVSVVLHELGHGLGFVDSYSVSGSTGYLGIDSNDGYPMVYDLSLENSSGKNLFQDYAAPSTALRSQLVSSAVYFNSPLVLTSNTGTHAKIYAPGSFSSGSSISHLDEATFKSGDVNSLMTPAIGAAEVAHDPGPIVKSAFSDMGWVFTRIDHTPISSTEDVNTPFTVTATIASDVGSISNPTLHYNTGNADITLAMQPTGNSDEFSATIPSSGTPTTYNYYISVDDAIRNYTVPGKLRKYKTEISQTYYSFTAAPDNVPPTITHTATKTILNTFKTLPLDVVVTDNLGVKTVWIDYLVNNIPQSTVTLTGKQDSVYHFDLPLSSLSIGDVIKYRIAARDVAVIGNAQGNVFSSPSSTTYNIVNVTGLQAARESYSNSFDIDSDDFYGTGFSVTTPAEFTNGAIHSDHPYKEGQGQPNNEFSLTYELLVPIRVKALDATIRFDEIVLVEPGATGAEFGSVDFYDYVVVEGSADGGSTWTPIANGYDSNDKTVWLTRYSSAATAIGDPSLYRPRELNLLSKFAAGQDVVIRFRLYSDQLTAGWGWAIDNLKIQIDETPPLILHNHVDYVLNDDPTLDLNIKATDNSGIQTIGIEYIIKGDTTIYSPEINTETSTYEFTIQEDGLAAGDTIQYRILAADSKGNIATLPTEGFIRTIVFTPSEAKSQYANDFNTPTEDFIGNYFNISTPDNFSNPMINSSHNYSTGFGLDGTSMFSYMLSTPIIVNESNPYIKYDEVALIEGQLSSIKFGTSSFNDYVILQGSSDGGLTWKNFADGYDAVLQSTWLTAFNGNKVGTSSMYKSHTVSMVNETGFKANDKVLIRFSLFSNSAVTGWGWAIDNLNIQTVVTGNTEIVYEEGLHLYPNPSSTLMNVSLQNITDSTVKLSVLNLQGMSLQSNELTATGTTFNYELNTTSFQSGLYLLKLTTGGKTYLKKFAKE